MTNAKPPQDGSHSAEGGRIESLREDTRTAMEAVESALTAHRPRAFQEAELRALLERELSKAEAKERGVQLLSELEPAELAKARARVSRRRRSLTTLLEEQGKLVRAVLLPDEPKYRSIKRVVLPGCTPLELGTTIRGGGYFTHSTAVFLHGLTDSVPTTFYINKEQSPKPPPSGGLNQERLDKAFRTKQRRSRYTFRWGKYRFTILSGKNSGDFGVVQQAGPNGERLRVTHVERTLIDIVARPAYAGGLVEVLHAYTSAVERGVDVQRLIATLDHLDYVYPYHQVIGYLLERAGLEADELELLRARGLHFDMPAAHGIVRPSLDSSWRVVLPEGF